MSSGIDQYASSELAYAHHRPCLIVTHEACTSGDSPTVLAFFETLAFILCCSGSFRRAGTQARSNVNNWYPSVNNTQERAQNVYTTSMRLWNIQWGPRLSTTSAFFGSVHRNYIKFLSMHSHQRHAPILGAHGQDWALIALGSLPDKSNRLSFPSLWVRFQ